MPPIVKENEISTARPERAPRSSSVPGLPGDSAIKQQPVALEVPVTINGARTVEGSDKREPFSETTKTVLVFGSGAVIRLASSVTPGQLLFLTNEKTKKEVVCQVVKSKNYRNVSGYVELEFTESVVGFWGMRFPGDRLAAVPRPVVPAPVAPSSNLASGLPAAPPPVAPVTAAPPVKVASSIVSPKPAAPASLTRDSAPKLSETKFVFPAAPAVHTPSAPAVQDLMAQKPVAPAAPLSSTLSSSFDPTAPLKLPSAVPVVPAVPAAPVSTDPEFKVDLAPEDSAASSSALFESPRASEVQASFLEPAKTSAVPPTPSVPNPNSFFEVKPATPADEPPAVQVFADTETETLKKHTARLEEELSSLMFSPIHPAHPAVVVDVSSALEKKETFEASRKVLEIPKAPQSAPVPAKPFEPAKSLMAPAIPSLGDEELKIPAWLEPLARNAAAPSSTQELIEREKAKRIAEKPVVEEFAAETSTAPTESRIAELPLPTFDNTLPMDERPSVAEVSASRSSGRGLRIAAIAAGILLVGGGGWWYMQQQGSGVPDAAASNVQASVASLPATSLPSQPSGNALPQTNPPAQTNPAALANTSVKSKSTSNALNVVPATSTVAVRNPQLTAIPAKGGAGLPASALTHVATAPDKKTILGQVHLATPKVAQRRNAQNAGEADAGIALTNDDQPEPNTGALNAGLVGDNKQPVAPAVPLVVGGDVVQAKLISSTPPIYPSLARNQHISGNVLVDALIDASGRVTTMKVVSGPALLHQAAMDALKQWKYRPATLDGKPTQMHLTVTVQFRLQ